MDGHGVIHAGDTCVFLTHSLEHEPIMKAEDINQLLGDDQPAAQPSTDRAAERGDPVVVTTEHRGVFFGYLTGDNNQSPVSVTLYQCRMCVSWQSSVRGVLGLAATGPNKQCRVSPAVPESVLWKITGVFTCTDDAAKAWEDAPWN